MNRRNLLLIVLLLLAGAIGYKYYTLNKNKNVAQTPEIKEVETPTDAPIATDEGVMLPDELKKGLTSVITDAGLGEDYQEEEEQNSILNENVSSLNIVEVDGPPPANMTKEQCQEKYRYSAANVALYASKNSRRDKLEDFTVCHAAADNDLSYCGGHKKPNACVLLAQRSAYIYQVLIGEEPTVSDFASIFGSHLREAELKDIIRQKRSLPSNAPPALKYLFKFVSGRTSSCAAVPDSLSHKGQAVDVKKQCILLADMVSGIKMQGMNKYFLYDANAKKNCSKVDEELVREYCNRKLERKNKAKSSNKTRRVE